MKKINYRACDEFITNAIDFHNKKKNFKGKNPNKLINYFNWIPKEKNSLFDSNISTCLVISLEKLFIRNEVQSEENQ